jgi:hypothetical protein
VGGITLKLNAAQLAVSPKKMKQQLFATSRSYNDDAACCEAPSQLKKQYYSSTRETCNSVGRG